MSKCRSEDWGVGEAFPRASLYRVCFNSCTPISLFPVLPPSHSRIRGRVRVREIGFGD